VAVPRADRVLPNEIFHDTIEEAPAVISTLPVWNVLDVVPEGELPEWYVAQIKYLAQDKYRIAWAGLYIATDEPVAVLERKELATWLHTPRARVPGFMFEMTAMDPSTAPEGKFLYTMGGILDFTRAHDLTYVKQAFHDFEQDVEQMWPGLAHATFKRRHFVRNPSFGVIQKPGLVGQFRPHYRAPNVEGLWFASETFLSRGIGVDRAARAGLTCAEDLLGRRLWPLEEGWRY
jgi:hypothetical protein